MDVQISLTVNEAKRLIAKGVVSLPEVKGAPARGEKRSMEECDGTGGRCGGPRACIVRGGRNQSGFTDSVRGEK